jgi:hypothetical protein
MPARPSLDPRFCADCSLRSVRCDLGVVSIVDLVLRQRNKYQSKSRVDSLLARDAPPHLEGIT